MLLHTHNHLASFNLKRRCVEQGLTTFQIRVAKFDSSLSVPLWVWWGTEGVKEGKASVYYMDSEAGGLST